MSAADFSRRRFLSAGGAALLAGWASGLPALRAALAQARRAAASPSPLPFEFFTAREGAELATITAHIWPADDFPGALETGIPHFIDAVFAGGADRSFADANFAIYDAPIGADPSDGGFAPLVRDGLASLDRRSAELFPGAGRWASLDAERQRQVLGTLETTPFFLLLRRMTVVGLFADPSYGGNAAKMGWRAIGFEDRFVWQPPFGAYDAGA